MLDALFLRQLRTKYIPLQALLGLWRVFMGVFLGITGLALVGYVIKTGISLFGVESIINGLTGANLGHNNFIDLIYYGVNGIAISAIVFLVFLLLIRVGDA